MIKDQIETHKLIIEGMDCQDEVTIIEKKLISLAGIKDFHVYLATQGVKVVCDPSLISIQQIIKSIAETGMKASAIRDVKPKIAWWKEKRIIALAACGLFTLTAFVLEKIGWKGIITIIIHSMAIITGGYYPAKMAFGALRTLTLNIRTLMVTGAIGAVALGLWEEASMLVFIYLLGDVLEIYTVSKSRGAVKMLMELAPKEALVRRDGQEMVLPVEEVKISDIIIIMPGEKIPLDGKVIKGYSSVDQSPITGESIPVEKKEGCEVFAGTFNQRGVLEVEVTKLSKDTTLAKIIHSVEEAQARKSSYQRFGERFGKYYTPAMFALAFTVAIVPPLLWGGFSYWFYRGLVVLVVSCSCGIALSVPVAVVAAIGNAARHGVLVKGGIYLEIAEKLKAIAFDKTGTITIGKPSITDIIPLNNQTEETIIQLAASIESRSEHPLGETIVNYAKEKGLQLQTVDAFESLPGMGAKAKIAACEYFIGNKRLFLQFSIPITNANVQISGLEKQGKTVVLLGSKEVLLGIIAVADRVRGNAKKVIQTLKHLGIEEIIMLTGDNEGTAAEITRETNIDEYYARLLPEDKVETVKRLKKKYLYVAMAGDGVNDAPAMAEADIGIAMGAAGTDIAIETSDFVLMSDDLSKIPYIIKLSQRAVKIIQQNIIVSLLIVSILVPVALFGWIGIVPGLLINEIGGLIVIANGLRLLREYDMKKTLISFKKILAVGIVVLVGIVLAVIILRMGKKSTVADSHEKGVLQHESGEQGKGRVEITPEAIQSAGIVIETASPVQMKIILELPGEIKLNADKVIHVVPRVSGMVSEVRKNLGDAVKQNEIIVVLSSRELAELKSAYLASIKRVELAKATFERKERLWKQKISPEKDYLASRQALAEEEIYLQAAAQKLLALGLSQSELNRMSEITDRGLTCYELKAQFDGVVIEKKIAVGEAIKEDADIFVIADLSAVWVDVTVYAKDLNIVKVGQKVTVRSKILDFEADGILTYLGSLVGEQTRTARGIVVVQNPEGHWRPGLFVTVEIIQEEVIAPVAVSVDAIQTLRDQPVVFVQCDSNQFEVRPVELGRNDGRWVEVLNGISPGEKYVARNSFILKAELGKAGLTEEH